MGNKKPNKRDIAMIKLREELNEARADMEMSRLESKRCAEEVFALMNELDAEKKKNTKLLEIVSSVCDRIFSVKRIEITKKEK